MTTGGSPRSTIADTGLPTASWLGWVRAFTLVELLVVMTIIIIILGFAVPAATTIVKGSGLTQGSQMVGDQLGLARQTALSRNHPVEVRFYQFSDPDVPGEVGGNPDAGRFRAMQLFEVPDSGVARPLDKIGRLPASIMMDAGATLSTLLDVDRTATGDPTFTTGATLNAPIPGVNVQYNAVSFRFLPDGSTSLPAASGKRWFLTLHDNTAGDKRSAPPPNFFTVQIDPSSGKTRNFRP